MYTFEPLTSAVQDRLTNWWKFGEQDTPCLLSWITQYSQKGMSVEDLPRYWMDPDIVIERVMERLVRTTCYGLAVPFHYIDFGASAMAGVLGCRMEYIDTETIWAYPVVSTIEEILDISLDHAQPVYNAIRTIGMASTACAHDHHYIAPFALEGLSDLMAALCGLENFLVDLIEQPDMVARAMAHLKLLWLDAVADIEQIISASGNKGGIGWPGIWAPGNTFPLQEDVAYNMSPAMFRRFCLPHVDEMAQAMDYAFFHLDGIGMIPHLDALLEVDAIRAIQWQPGAGKDEIAQWYGVIQRILAHKKSVQVYAYAHEVDALVSNVGTRGLMVILRDNDRDAVLSLLDCYPQ